MIYHKCGDLLESDCTVIMHQANCFSTMGAGIAKSIAKKYPGAANADMELELNPKDRFGSYSGTKASNGVCIINLYGQYNMGLGLQTNYKRLENAMNSFFIWAKSLPDNYIDLSKVGVPHKMGCGLAGGDWDIVKNIISRQSEIHDVNIYIYKL